MDHDLYKVLATGRRATTEGSYLEKKRTAAVKEVLAILGDHGSKRQPAEGLDDGSFDCYITRAREEGTEVVARRN